MKGRVNPDRFFGGIEMFRFWSLYAARCTRMILPALCIGLVVSTIARAHETDRHHGYHSLVVSTDKGRVKGIRRNAMREFLGMPYAAPPVGHNRWAPPQPVPAWHGVHKADTFASNCPQKPSPFGNPSTSEDCLYLNVFTPDDRGDHRRHGGDRDDHGKGHPHHNPRRHPGEYPVMVWLHGGAFVYGEGSDYDPAPLVHNGVIVVTINYRLGMLGFLSTPGLSAESPDHASGDYGLMDQQAALQWVQRNIGRFGGDPKNVTLFGVSAGGLSVLSQIASPTAHGLFDKAIVESGSYSAALPGLQPNLTTAEARGSVFAQAVGCAAQDVSCLRKLPVSTILANQGGGPLSVVPNTGTAILPNSITDALSTGSINHVPVIEGSNATEWRLFTALAYDLTPKGPVTASSYLQAIQDSFHIPEPVARVVASRYPVSAYNNADLALSAAGTAAAFACPARREIGLLSQRVPTYAYEFADPDAPQIFVPPVPSFKYGPTHTSEIQYFLNFTSSANLYKKPSFTPDQQRLAKIMTDYWTQFARSGNPNSRLGDAPFWPQYNDHQSYISLVPPVPQVISDDQFAGEHQCAFWDQLVNRLSGAAPG